MLSLFQAISNLKIVSHNWFYFNALSSVFRYGFLLNLSIYIELKKYIFYMIYLLQFIPKGFPTNFWLWKFGQDLNTLI